jgi:hypothetical protein
MPGGQSISQTTNKSTNQSTNQTPTWIRCLVLVYIVVLWLAVAVSIRPSLVHTSVAGPVFEAAASSLAAVTLVPGIPVFTDAGREWSDWIRTAICMTVTGHRGGGKSQTLYDPECPASGFQMRHDAFDELMQYTTRHLRLDALLDPAPVVDPADLPEATRRFVMLGDYFCHSTLIAPSDLTALTLHWTVHVRHYQTGDRAEQTLVCNWLCNQPGSFTPQCRMTPKKRHGAPVKF